MLLGNVIVNSGLAILLNQLAGGIIGGGVIGGVVATVLILFLREILPMSICVKNALYVGYCFVNLVWVLFLLLFLISWPIAVLLD